MFVARDGRLNREVALKLIEESQAADAQSRARFLLEAEITGGLEHPGIVPVYALGENSDGRLFYAMRLVRGETLKERIRKFHSAGSISRQPVPFRQLLNHFVRICDIVAYAHSRGVLHRDLKPSNVMLGKFGETLVVDWGLAKPIEPSGESQPAVLDEVDAAADLRQQRAGDLARRDAGDAAVHEPGAGARAARPGRPRERRLQPGRHAVLHPDGLSARWHDINDVGEVLSRVAHRRYCLAPEPESRTCRRRSRRFAARRWRCGRRIAIRRCRDLAADIESWLADEPVQGVPEPLARRLATWERKHRTFLRISGIALVAVAMVAVLAAFGVNAARERAEVRRLQADRADAGRRGSQAGS